MAILTDIDECLSPEYSEMCDQDCVNTPGSFFCNCTTGYCLLSDRTTCEGKV